jgi:CheY-like chemotaxis protein
MHKLKFTSKKDTEPLKSDFIWKILIADDEPEVHTITKTVLSNFEFENSKLEFISTYSGEETIKVIKEQPDIAIVLLDVVMETDDAGLVVAKKIRDEIDNHLIRIILRTGQPGSAPEKDVINKYEINDYKEKTELTTIKLYTTVMSALRSFRDLITIEQNRKGLLKIIEATKSIFEYHSLELFAEGVLTQLISILKLNHSSMIIKQCDGFSIEKNNNHFEVIAATGNFKNKNYDEISDPYTKELINKAIDNKSSFFDGNSYIGYFETKYNNTNIIFMTGCKELNPLDKHLIELFSTNVSIAFNNIHCNKLNT